jgi:DNA-binding transcriptional LysR family regulator
LFVWLCVLFADPLLVRSGRDLVPTPRAAALGPRVRGVLEGAAALLSPAQGGALERVVVGTADYGELVGVPLLLRALAPTTRVELRFVGGDVERALQRGDLHLFLGAGAPPLEGVVQRRLLKDENVVVVRRGSGRRRPLEGRAFIAVAPRGVGDGLFDTPAAQGWRPRVAVTTPHFSSAVELARRTELAALVPRRLVDALGRDGLEVLPPPVTLPPFWLCLYAATPTLEEPRWAALRQAVAEQARLVRGS